MDQENPNGFLKSLIPDLDITKYKASLKEYMQNLHDELISISFPGIPDTREIPGEEEKIETSWSCPLPEISIPDINFSKIETFLKDSICNNSVSLKIPGVPDIRETTPGGQLDTNWCCSFPDINFSKIECFLKDSLCNNLVSLKIPGIPEIREIPGRQFDTNWSCSLPDINLPNISYPYIDFSKIEFFLKDSISDKFVSLKMLEMSEKCKTSGEPLNTNSYCSLSDKNYPDISVTEISLPEISFPELTMPDISFPDINLPEISFPEISFPTIGFPEINLPTISFPDLKLSKIESFLKDTFVPLNMPGIPEIRETVGKQFETNWSCSLSGIHFPDIRLPEINFPDINLSKTKSYLKGSIRNGFEYLGDNKDENDTYWWLNNTV